MPKIDGIEVQKLRIDIKDLERHFNEMEGQSEKESIWAIHPKWRGWFYGILSICGIVMSARAVCDKWCGGWSLGGLLDLSKNIVKIEIFNEIGRVVFRSVVIVWFGFHVMESVVGSYQYFQGLRKSHSQKIRKEERERFVKFLESQKVSEKIIRNAKKFSDSSSKDR